MIPVCLRRVIRVSIYDMRNARTYAYRCRGCRKGDLVKVPIPGDVLYRRVVGYGRHGYFGRLKRAERVQQPHT